MVRFAAWSGYGRVRHSVYLGLSEDKAQGNVAHPLADPAAKRQEVRRRPSSNGIVETSAPRRRRRNYAVLPRRGEADSQPAFHRLRRDEMAGAFTCSSAVSDLGLHRMHH